MSACKPEVGGFEGSERCWQDTNRVGQSSSPVVGGGLGFGTMVRMSACELLSLCAHSRGRLDTNRVGA